MNLMNKILFLITYVSVASCTIASDILDRDIIKMQKDVQEWENLGLRKKWSAIDSKEEYEFFLWSPNGYLEWYVIHVVNNGSQQQQKNYEKMQLHVHWGFKEEEYSMKIFDRNLGIWILHVIDANELFRLPKYSAPKSHAMHLDLGTMFFLCKHKKDGITTEIIRHRYISVPVNNVIFTIRKYVMGIEKGSDIMINDEGGIMNLKSG